MSKGSTLAYLRFTPDEYSLITEVCGRHDLGRRNLPTFKRVLVESLAEVSPGLARVVARLRRSSFDLLYCHFRDRTPLTPQQPAQEFTCEELRLVEEACVSAPFPVRFVRPFKTMLVEMLDPDEQAGTQRARAVDPGHAIAL